MGSLLNFVFLNDKLIGNGDGSYGQNGPFFNYIVENNLNYTTHGELRSGFKNVFPIEVVDAGFSTRNIPDEVFNFIKKTDIKLMLIGIADPTSMTAYNESLKFLEQKIDLSSVIFIDSNKELSLFKNTYTFNFFIEEATRYKDTIFLNKKNQLNYISENIELTELTSFRHKKFLSFNRALQKFHRFILFYEYLKKTFSDSYFSFIIPIVYLDEIKPYFEKYSGLKLSDVDIEVYNEKLPIELDTFLIKNKESFQTNNTFKKELFLNSCINIVTETTFIDNEIFLSEKILKPILGYQPFIVFGPHGYLSELKTYGFKTFSEFWDESYDDIEDPILRLKALMQLVKYLNNKSIEELNDIYKSTIDICIHNRNLFYSLELDSLKVILGEIENEW